MSLRVLIISSSPSHPQNAGDRARIHTLVNWLRARGDEVHFLFISGTERDLPAMRAYWGERLYFVFSNFREYPWWRRGANLLKRLLKVDQLRRRLWYGGGMGADEYYTPLVRKQVEQVLHGKPFDVVICEYIFYSKVLETLDDRTLKIIDTHDAQSIRDKRFLKNMFHTTPAQEAKALNRADLVMAIQAREKAYFESITSRKVILLGHPVQLDRERPRRPHRKKLLFIGSTFEGNVTAVGHFIANIFPLVRADLPETELMIAGRVCERIGDYEGCRKVGTVENVSQLYHEADVAINPTLAGRGLKIKNIEALGYATPLVTTGVGAEGLEEGAGKAFLTADTPAAFAGSLKRLLTDFSFYCAISDNAYTFAKQYNESTYLELAQELENHGQ